MDYSLGNFGFLKNEYGELYELLLQAESKAHTDFEACGLSCRLALEKIINDQIKKNGWDDYFKDPRTRMEDSLSQMLNKLSDESFLKKIGFLQENETMEEKSFFPKLSGARFSYRSGRKVTKRPWHEAIRRAGNTSVHDITDPDKIVVLTYHLALRCVKYLFDISKHFYLTKEDSDYREFIDERMPIEDYFMIEGTMDDTKEKGSSLVCEFMAYKKDFSEQVLSYAFIRMYDNPMDKSTADEEKLTMLLRNQQAFSEASRQEESKELGVEEPKEMPGVTVTTDKTTFYFIVQEFHQEPKLLEDFLMEKEKESFESTRLNRMKLCAKISDCMNKLHNLENPIYHRMLSYQSLCITELSGEWKPHFIKFDYAKISSGGANTIYSKVKKRTSFLSEETLTKYIAPEWNEISEDTRNYQWASVDVFSLGVLFGDILTGRITEEIVTYDELKDAGYSDEISGLIEDMTSEVPEVRWPIDDIADIFISEVSHMEKSKRRQRRTI